MCGRLPIWVAYGTFEIFSPFRLRGSNIPKWGLGGGEYYNYYGNGLETMFWLVAFILFLLVRKPRIWARPEFHTVGGRICFVKSFYTTIVCVWLLFSIPLLPLEYVLAIANITSSSLITSKTPSVTWDPGSQSKVCNYCGPSFARYPIEYYTPVHWHGYYAPCHRGIMIPLALLLLFRNISVCFCGR